MNIIFVLLGGWLGAIARYELSRQGQRIWKKDFPLPTLLTNTAGSFLLGLVYQLSWGAEWQNFFAVCFLGSFTTFSTFHLELVQLGSKRKIAAAISYVLSSYALGIALAIIGLSM
ncbi:camphor resistance protein CrcB [Terribacillus aidingensis]|uniref:Fluoride-specific ion channel FluC n=1 Tax=Terribacillus aidingensis TaxID=586416 RepID=A0A285P683_9BACI|nr:CrcB family protein [Terribacillus aidingensis]SNZ16958.1 camphor resistance protein CrcB [Terribacillus aidingensis]